MFLVFSICGVGFPTTRLPRFGRLAGLDSVMAVEPKRFADGPLTDFHNALILFKCSNYGGFPDQRSWSRKRILFCLRR